MTKALISVVLLVLSVAANAATRENACIKYETQYGWSQGYSVQATVLDGSALNQAVGSLTRFQSFATYAVVFWGQDQASIFKLPPDALGNLPFYWQTVQDQTGRSWQIEEDNGLCM